MWLSWCCCLICLLALKSVEDDVSKIQEERKDYVGRAIFHVPFSYIQASSVVMIFFQVCDSVIELLASFHIEILHNVCKNLMASHQHAIKFFSENQMKRLKNYDTSLLLLQSLSLFFTWSNHSILRAVANQCSEATKILYALDDRIDSFKLITSYPIPYFSLSMVPVDTSTHTILAIRCDQELHKSTLQYVYDMQSVMVEKFDITQHCLQLLAVRSYPTMFYWTIPKCVVHLINGNVAVESKYLHSKGILEVLVYPDLQFTFGDHFSIGSLGFHDDSIYRLLKNKVKLPFA